jgi:hypothetical protein
MMQAFCISCPLAPYGLGLKLDQPSVSEDIKKKFRWLPDEFTNSIKLDEELTDSSGTIRLFGERWISTTNITSNFHS